jgi:hypothetical protein
VPLGGHISGATCVTKELQALRPYYNSLNIYDYYKHLNSSPDYHFSPNVYFILLLQYPHVNSIQLTLDEA